MAEVTDRAVLIVDDQPEIVDLISRCLRHGGFKNVSQAHTGSDAAIRLRFDGPAVDPPPFDLILLDVVLPDTSGFKLCEKIKAKYPDVRVILISGYSIESIQAQVIESGADDFLAKPFNHQELLARVRIHLHKVALHRHKPLTTDTVLMGSKPKTGTTWTVRPCDGIGDYEVLRSIVRTGATVIYLVRHKPSGELRVLKMMLPHLVEYADVIARFKQEVHIIRHLTHDNIVRWHDDGSWHECPYLVQEYIDGADLERHINGGAVFKHSELLRIAREVASALQAIHDAGIIHRDIKPKNILMRKSDGEIKLFDFGISFKMGEARVTQAEYTVGTPLYMAPEMFESGKVSHTADIYSFGVTMYHIATGRLPFVSDSVAELVRCHQSLAPVPIQVSRPELPSGWNDLIVHRCMAKVEDDRPQSMRAVLNALASI